MNKNLLIALLFLTVPAIAVYNAKEARQEANKVNNINDAVQYPSLMTKIDSEIKQAASTGSYMCIIIVSGYHKNTITHAIHTLAQEGYAVEFGDNKVITVNWEEGTAHFPN